MFIIKYQLHKPTNTMPLIGDYNLSLSNCLIRHMATNWVGNRGSLIRILNTSS